MKYPNITLGRVEAVWNKLGGEEGVDKFLRGVLTVQAVAASIFTRDMAKKGWTLLEDVPGDPLPIDKLDPISFLETGESYIGGEEMVKRAASLKANMGQRQAEYLLKRQDTIPEEYRNHILVFPGTIWRDRVGSRNVPCLFWDGERWSLDFHWLGYDWFSRYRLLRPRE